MQNLQHENNYSLPVWYIYIYIYYNEVSEKVVKLIKNISL